MRVATFLSAAAIAVLATAGPAFAFAVVKTTATPPYLMLVKNDSGSVRQFPNCEAARNCTNDTIEVLMGRQGNSTLTINCNQVGGCAIVGPK